VGRMVRAAAGGDGNAYELRLSLELQGNFDEEGRLERLRTHALRRLPEQRKAYVAHCDQVSFEHTKCTFIRNAAISLVSTHPQILAVLAENTRTSVREEGSPEGRAEGLGSSREPGITRRQLPCHISHLNHNLPLHPTSSTQQTCPTGSRSSSRFPSSSSVMETKSAFAMSKLNERSELTFRDLQFLTRCTKPTQKGQISSNDMQVQSVSNVVMTSRVLAHLQGSRHWFCCNGLHRLLCETHPHPNVRGTSYPRLPHRSHLASSNNILVYVPRSRFFPRTNVSQQRWSIVDSGYLLLSWDFIYHLFRLLSAVKVRRMVSTAK